MINFGLMEIRELNFSEAYKWLSKAAEKGNYQAMEIIEKYKLDKAASVDIDPKVLMRCIENY